MSLYLRHYVMAPDYRISVLTMKDKNTGRYSKIRIHKRRVKKKFRTIMAYLQEGIR